MVFNVQRYSTHDGDGIRTLVFYKGCPLRCRWCSNPESQSFGPSVLFDAGLCKHFGDCLSGFSHAISEDKEKGRRINRSAIQDAEGLRELCVAKALQVSGEIRSPLQLMEQVKKDLPFYQSNGGVTLSGGEPLAQGEDMVEFLHLLKAQKIPVNVESSLHVAWEKIERTIGLVDTYLADLKHLDAAKFSSHIGGDAELVRRNLIRLCESGAKVIVRVPVIPGFNHSTGEMEQLISFVAELEGMEEVHFLPFHRFGKNKYKMLDMADPMEGISSLDEDELLEYKLMAEGKGLRARIGG